LCALAPRPRLLLLDEPFPGMDVLVKDVLVRGLLASATDAGTTIVVASHDLVELETVIDHLGMLRNGSMLVSAPMDELRARFRRVTVTGTREVLAAAGRDDAWLGLEQAGQRLTFVADGERTALIPQALEMRFAGADRIECDEPSLRELFTTLAGNSRQSATGEVAA
jgi:ABC-type multidrug transport system ATPase subunit